MSTTYNIRITDTNDVLIGELMTATPIDITKFIDKGLKVIDLTTKKEIHREDVADTICVSECVM